MSEAAMDILVMHLQMCFYFLRVTSGELVGSQRKYMFQSSFNVLHSCQLKRRLPGASQPHQHLVL